MRISSEDAVNPAAFQERLFSVLTRYVSPITARGMIQRAVREAEARSGRIESRDIPRLIEQFVAGTRLFVDAGKRADVEAELRKLLDAPQVSAQSFAVRTERDVSTARLAARAICEDMGASSLLTQKVSTAVSELARNIVMYAVEGTIEMGPLAGERRGVFVRAQDRGPGIANLELVLSGKYKSKSGLGAGLRGVQRLSDRFGVDSKPGNTRIEIEVWF